MGIMGRRDIVKAIAIMDKPKKCQECVFGICKYSLPLSIHRKAYYCQLKEPKGRVAEDFDYDEEVHLSNCPLKEVPQKQPTEMKTINDDINKLVFNEGYNHCIDEILGDKE